LWATKRPRPGLVSFCGYQKSNIEMSVPRKEKQMAQSLKLQGSKGTGSKQGKARLSSTKASKSERGADDGREKGKRELNIVSSPFETNIPT
jgi:hypothetical protein